MTRRQCAGGYKGLKIPMDNGKSVVGTRVSIGKFIRGHNDNNIVINYRVCFSFFDGWIKKRKNIIRNE